MTPTCYAQCYPQSAALACPPGAATPATPFLFVEALAALGRPEAALSVLRARGAGLAGREMCPGGAEDAGAGGARGGPEPLAEAETALAIRLSCGLVTEGFLEVTSPGGVGEKVQGCPCQPQSWGGDACNRRRGGMPCFAGTAPAARLHRGEGAWSCLTWLRGDCGPWAAEPIVASGPPVLLQSAARLLGAPLRADVRTAPAQARRHCDGAPAAERAERARALVRRMAEWAAGAGAVFAVIQLPLNGVEEQVPSRARIALQ
jgi:hypothetical protein